MYMERFYPNLDKSDVQVYDGLDYRHWDTGTKESTTMFF
jgi:hypothetical protein